VAGEFYLEYGDFDVTLIVPDANIVAATGDLRNPDQVLTVAQRERLSLARQSDTVVAIIRADEGRTRRTRHGRRQTRCPAPRREPGTLSRVTCAIFAFATGPNLAWDAKWHNGILIERPRIVQTRADGAR
jgi:hypothetical protein